MFLQSLPLFTLGRREKFAIGGNGNVEMRGGNVPGGERGGRYSTCLKLAILLQLMGNCIQSTS